MMLLFVLDKYAPLRQRLSREKDGKSLTFDLGEAFVIRRKTKKVTSKSGFPEIVDIFVSTKEI